MSQTIGQDIETAESSPETLSRGRRSFLGATIGAIGAAITAVLGVTIGRYTVGPSFNGEGSAGWTALGLVSDLPDGKWTKRNVTVSQDSGWGRFNSQRPVWVLKNGSKLSVFTATCPHLGCTVNVAAGGFVCPCHGSQWSAEGARTGGPTPRGLDTLESRINGDTIEVKYEYFKQGVPEKVALS
ncbi:MAG: ubiquinol-cytochrome c reductase iron-sulfur subunit [Blastocatellia bacterium]